MNIDKNIQREICELYKTGKTITEICNLIGVCRKSINIVLKNNEIPIIKSRSKLNLPEQQIISLYKQQHSTCAIAKQFNTSTKTICDILKKYHIDRNNPQGAFNLDRNYFNNIDRFDKAYFLGLLLTDGNVWNKQIRLEIKDEDQHILVTFAKYIGRSEAKIHKRISNKLSKLASYTVYCSNWVDDLSKWTITQNKTYTAKMPILNDELMPHLIRGMIDGDGYISKDGSQIGFCGGNYENVKLLKDFLVSHLGLNDNKIVKTNNGIFDVKWGSKKDVLKLGNYIYKDKKDCYLIRKYNRWFTKFISYANPEVNE